MSCRRICLCRWMMAPVTILPGMQLPAISLMSTSGTTVDLSQLPGRTVLYCYPRTGRPGEASPDGWDLIPGARGCTPQSCAFRDHHAELQQLHARVFGLSAQDTAYQQEAVQRLHLPFELLSDAELTFTQALRLPTFVVASMTLIKRVTLLIENGQIIKVFYPVFPPDQNAAQVIRWLIALSSALDQAIQKLSAGLETAQDRAVAREAVQLLRTRGVDGIILGCTEIPLLLQEEADDLINPLQLLAEAAVRHALR